jgi:2'-5' RNA ligase
MFHMTHFEAELLMKSPRFYRYFLALLPAWEARLAIAAIRDGIEPLRSIVLNIHLHMTLALLAETFERDLSIARRVDAAMRGHSLEECEIWLRQLVLRPRIAYLKTTGRQPQLQGLRKKLVQRLAAHGLPLLCSKAFQPHTTLGYGIGSKGKYAIDPIGWRACGIVLVESWYGQTRHEILGRWPLLPPEQGSFRFQPDSSLSRRPRADGERVDAFAEQVAERAVDGALTLQSA